MYSPQDGHRDEGQTMDWRSGTLWITTFKKLPITRPKSPATTASRPTLLHRRERRNTRILLHEGPAPHARILPQNGPGSDAGARTDYSPSRNPCPRADHGIAVETGR